MEERKEMKKKKVARWPDYKVVKMKDVVTFGTVVFLRRDKKAIRIVFPAGTVATFAPLDETEETNSHSLKKEDGE